MPPLGCAGNCGADGAQRRGQRAGSGVRATRRCEDCTGGNGVRGASHGGGTCRVPGAGFCRRRRDGGWLGHSGRCGVGRRLYGGNRRCRCRRWHNGSRCLPQRLRGQIVIGDRRGLAGCGDVGGDPERARTGDPGIARVRGGLLPFARCCAGQPCAGLNLHRRTPGGLQFHIHLLPRANAERQANRAGQRRFGFRSAIGAGDIQGCLAARQDAERGLVEGSISYSAPGVRYGLRPRSSGVWTPKHRRTPTRRRRGTHLLLRCAMCRAPASSRCPCRRIPRGTAASWWCTRFRSRIYPSRPEQSGTCCRAGAGYPGRIRADPLQRQAPERRQGSAALP